MNKTRILICDDAVVVRRLLTDVLAAEPDLEVVGSAPNGRIGLAKIPQVNPDLLILDIEMPEMDGLQTLEALRKTHPRLPVIMFSTMTQRGAMATLDALALGANDYVAKPAKASGVTAVVERIREELIPRIRLLGRPREAFTASPARPRRSGRTSDPTIRIPQARPQRVEIVAVGVSTGGPNALAALLPALAADFPVPIVLVQHMPPLFTRLLAERLAAQSALRVKEAVMGDRLVPGNALLAPGDFHMAVSRGASGAFVRLHQAPPENSCRPAVDVLFRSVADVYGPAVLGVVLTGMGQDGLRGCERIHDAGGQIIVQDEATSVVWGMPGFVARAGLADQVLPLHQMSAEITRRVLRGRPATLPA